jgi:hypothetical protein
LNFFCFDVFFGVRECCSVQDNKQDQVVAVVVEEPGLERQYDFRFGLASYSKK